MCSVPNGPNVSFSHSTWAFEPGELQETVQHLESEGDEGWPRLVMATNFERCGLASGLNRLLLLVVIKLAPVRKCESCLGVLRAEEASIGQPQRSRDRSILRSSLLSAPLHRSAALLTLTVRAARLVSLWLHSGPFGTSHLPHSSCFSSGSEAVGNANGSTLRSRDSCLTDPPPLLKEPYNANMANAFEFCAAMPSSI
eukprot:s5350_g4.t1